MQLFYPSHDIALSNGVRHFNPPAAAMRLQEDLASLSEIWNQPYRRGEQPIPLPWGWDYDTRKYIHDAHVIKMTQLPTDQELEVIRQLSSRRTTIGLLEHLNAEAGPFEVSEPRWIDSEEQLFDYIRQQQNDGRRFVLKTPWSSSGRGLLMSHNRNREGRLNAAHPEVLMRQARGTIKKMGGIIGETWIEGKERDFAMLFYASDKAVRFIGYSLFDNDNSTGGTTYRQGYLLSNEEIEKRLGVDAERLHLIAQTLEGCLTHLAEQLLHRPWQLGYMGIDMMTYKQDGELRIHPCIELNLRCTMGVVCRLWYDQHQQEGTFSISPMMTDGHFKAEFTTGR